MADGYFVSQEEAELVEMRPGLLRRTMGTTDEAMLCEFRLTKGIQVVPHSHYNDQVGYVVSGQVAITVGEDRYICNPGDSYAIPGGVIHFAEAIVDSVTIDVFSPPRNDYRTEAR